MQIPRTALVWDSTSPAGPSSSTISTAPAPAGYRQCTAASAASMASASIISIAPGRMPELMMADTAAPPAPIVVKAASSVVTASGTGVSLTMILVAMPRVPSEPVKAPMRSYPGAAPVPSPSQVRSPSGVTISSPVT